MDVGPKYPGATREKTREDPGEQNMGSRQTSAKHHSSFPEPCQALMFSDCSTNSYIWLPKARSHPLFPNPVGQLSPLPCRPLGNGPKRSCWAGEKCIPAIILKGYSCQTHCVCGNTCWVAVAVGRARWRKTAVKVPAAVGSSAKTALCQLEMCQIIWLHFKYLGVHYICQLTLPGNTSALTPLLPRSCCSPTLISAFTFPCFFYSCFLLVQRKAQYCSAEPKIRAGICSWWEDKAPL